MEGVNDILDSANKYHPSIKLTREIGTAVAFLDVFIENRNGGLLTSVYHKKTAEPHVLSFEFDHPRHIFRNIIQGALFRASLYSSTIDAFDEERRLLEITLLYNR